MVFFDNQIQKYVELFLKIGVNIQMGQILLITAPITSVEIVRRISINAYKLGAKNVYVEWNDDELKRIKLLMESDETLNDYPLWRAKSFADLAGDNAAFLNLISPNPYLLVDIDPKKVAISNKAYQQAMKEFINYKRTDKISWSNMLIPSKEWAHIIFPYLTGDEAVNKLWEYLFKITRIDTKMPIDEWSSHLNNLTRIQNFLNERRYKKLTYKSPDTQLTVELPENHIWVSGGSTNEMGTFFIPNIPTEEVFTLPDKNGVNGFVRNTKPLCYSGFIIENFTLNFKNGKIIDFKAEKGYEMLKELIETDEGAAHLGEVSLVAHDSPISKLNINFYNIGIDENAASHVALGNAYPICLREGTNMTKEELEYHGANQSLIHIDFMIGSSKMDVDGEVAGGRIEPIMRNGRWVI
ncbi:MAG: aminopeptidase [Paenibacillaceae bacterium]